MTPESALGRLINLREQLMFCGDWNHAGTNFVTYKPKHWSECIDDLDDIIRSIERELGKSEPDMKWVVPDSEDTEPRITSNPRTRAHDRRRKR